MHFFYRAIINKYKMNMKTKFTLHVCVCVE